MQIQMQVLSGLTDKLWIFKKLTLKQLTSIAAGQLFILMLHLLSRNRLNINKGQAGRQFTIDYLAVLPDIKRWRYISFYQIFAEFAE